MSSIFSRSKTLNITVETGEELKGLFDSIVLNLEVGKVVKDLIVLLLASHQTYASTINESEYGLYLKDNYSLQLLDSNKTLKENRVKAKVL